MDERHDCQDNDPTCVPGLAVRVVPSGVKTWDLAYRIRGSGKVRRVSLGRVADVSLDGILFPPLAAASRRCWRNAKAIMDINA